MQHLFESYMKHKDEQFPIQFTYLTDSSRYGKVAGQILKAVNKLRKVNSLPAWERNDLEEYKIRKLR